MTPPPDDLLRLHRTMLLIREFEEVVGRLMTEGRIPGFVHLSTGQEAIAAGSCDVLRRSDSIASTHRGHGHCIAKGGEVHLMMAEMFGKPEGYCRGRSGSMHIADPDAGILGANAIVGGGIPMTVGAALSAQVRGSDDVSVVYFGEGAVANGVFHECLNLAALWALPVIFVCENNQYVELTHVSTHLHADSVAAYGEPHGLPSVTADGNDVVEVRRQTSQAVDRARRGDGPSLLEFQTYRWSGHFVGDPQSYRSADEVDRWKERDPIARLEGHMTDTFGMASASFDRHREEVAEAVQRAVAWASELPDPDGTIVTDDVYRSLSRSSR
jgi:acetoin:2,6-dichlorophenolindophenol oxidoreductase subunit alpha